MSFSFGTPKTASGFTLPTTSAPTASTAPTIQFSTGSGAGDATAASKPALGLFATPSTATSTPFSLGSTPAKTTAATGLSFGSTIPASTPGCICVCSTAATAVTTQTALNLSGVATTTSATSTLGSLLTSAPSASLSFGTASTTTTVGQTPTSTAVSATSSAPTFGFSTPAATTPSSNVQFSLGGTAALTTTTTAAATATSQASAAAATTTQSVLPQTGTLTFAQLEDAINKWTIQLEDQSKIFMNQAKQLTAWDRLLIANGEKVVNISNGLERIKQQQQQLDHELDFVLSQQKELEDLIVPLEKELTDLPIHDHDRYSIYQIAETLDSQLKQMSDDLKDAIDQINETGKHQNSNDPISQIAKILNAHMNSLQWIDRNSAQVNTYLDQISKMQEQMIHFHS